MSHESAVEAANAHVVEHTQSREVGGRGVDVVHELPEADGEPIVWSARVRAWVVGDRRSSAKRQGHVGEISDDSIESLPRHADTARSHAGVAERQCTEKGEDREG